MFNIASDNHPAFVNDIFIKAYNFNRNMEFINSKVDSSTKLINFPCTGTRKQSSTPKEFRNWSKFTPYDCGNKNIFAGPTKISLISVGKQAKLG